MSIEVEIIIYKTRAVLRTNNSGQTLKYILPVPTSVQYDPNWASVSFVYSSPQKRTERKINSLSEKIGALITTEPPNYCGRWGMLMNLPQCYRVSIQDKGRVKEMKKNLLERAK